MKIRWRKFTAQTSAKRSIQFLAICGIIGATSCSIFDDNDVKKYYTTKDLAGCYRVYEKKTGYFDGPFTYTIHENFCYDKDGRWFESRGADYLHGQSDYAKGLGDFSIDTVSIKFKTFGYYKNKTLRRSVSGTPNEATFGTNPATKMKCWEFPIPDYLESAFDSLEIQKPARCEMSIDSVIRYEDVINKGSYYDK